MDIYSVLRAGAVGRVLLRSVWLVLVSTLGGLAGMTLFYALSTLR